MRGLALTLVAVLAACSSEPTEEERAAAVAEVEAHQTLPRSRSNWERSATARSRSTSYTGRDAASHPRVGDWHCSRARHAFDTGHIIVDGEMLTLAADKGSAELPYLRGASMMAPSIRWSSIWIKMRVKKWVREVSDYPATLTIRNARDQIVYNQSGIAQCGV